MDKRRILVVDDDMSATRLVKLSLEKSGAYQVREENKGSRGLTAAREFKPDVILLDVDMPDADGGEVAAQIRADRSVNHIPIIFLTSIVSEREAGDSGLVSGGNHFLAKPVNSSRLIERIEDVLKR